MNPFERFGIDHLSPSSLNLYAANPCMWVGRYLLQWKDEFGPAATRGSAVEAGLDSFLFQRDTEKAIQAAYQYFAANTNGLADEDHEAERSNLEPMVLQACAAMAKATPPNSRQLRIEHYVDGVEVPIIGYIDYLWEDHGVDLKTTRACPGSIKSDHGRQIATYSKAKGRPFRILYVTAKKYALYPMGNNESAMHLRDLERHARAVRHLLMKSESPQDAALFFAPDPSEFRWNEKTLELANTVYR